MAKPELISTLSTLSKKIDSLIATQEKLKNRVIELEFKNQELRKQHEEDLKLISKAQQDIDYLTMSYRLADSPEALVEARNKISKLIKAIDSCIRLIRED